MKRKMLSWVSLVLAVCMVTCTLFTSAFAADSIEYENDTDKRTLFPREFSSEEEAGILTDEASAKIKEMIKEQGITDIDLLLEPYFKNFVREDGYMEPSLFATQVGATRYRRTYDNSGIITYKKKNGVWAAIASATISSILGKVKYVGDILSFTYSFIGGYEPDYQKEAEAKTQYSYRYIEDRGEVYYLDYTYEYRTRAIAISREKYEHEYGYYIDSRGYAKSHTRDYFGSIETLNAPHKGNATWLKNKAYNQWYYGLPAHYEDWND